MFGNLFRNMPDVTKNLLILNVLFFIATIFVQPNGLPLGTYLGMHYPQSALFEPYQIVTYMFMHGDLMHLFFNMFAVVIFGSVLEKVWGAKRYIAFYFACGFGALAAHLLVDYFMIQAAFESLNYPILIEEFGTLTSREEVMEFVNGKGVDIALNQGYFTGDFGTIHQMHIGLVGASGSVFGLLVAFGLLFPNTELMLLFPPIPIKAKYLVSAYVVLELYMGYQMNPNDNVAHFAHLGGALIGFILVMIWRGDRRNFY